MTPLESYRQDCQRADFVSDKTQEEAVLALDELYRQLLAANSGHKSFRLRKRSPKPVKGLYMWGGVGRGKTYLMDTFFDALPLKKKRRLHFHRFMQEVHHALNDRQGEKNPLEGIADSFAKEVRVLCLDEFFVTDITDAMLLGGLLTALFARGVSLVTTSNIEPDGLYRNGLQRQRFLPAIEQLKRYTRVLNVDGGEDFRLRHESLSERYLCPLDEHSDAYMEQWVGQLVGDDELLERNTDIRIEGRLLPVRALGSKVGWFDFRTLCDGPRSQNDYIALARRFDTLLLSRVERMNGSCDNIARRFVNLIDELYDSGVKLVVSAEVPIAELYGAGKLEFEFERTASRLQEMQSQEYLALPRRL